MNLVNTNQPIKLGRQLGVAECDLHIVERDHPNDHGEQLSDVLSLYMRQSVRPSWMEVATALWNIGEKTAKNISDKYGIYIYIYSQCAVYSLHQMSYMNMISVCHHALIVVPYALM